MPKQDKQVTAESIVERILFGKGGSKKDYAQDINNLVSIKVKEACEKQLSTIKNAMALGVDEGSGEIVWDEKALKRIEKSLT